jgi:hypothetical protein
MIGIFLFELPVMGGVLRYGWDIAADAVGPILA